MNPATIFDRAADYRDRAANCLAAAESGSLSPTEIGALHSAARELRDAAARLDGASVSRNSIEAPDFVAGVPPIPSQAPPKSARALSSGSESAVSENRLRSIAAGAPFSRPTGMLEKAIANTERVDAFALAVADYCAAERSQLARDHNAELEHIVARILASDSPILCSPKDPAVDAIAMRIAAA